MSYSLNLFQGSHLPAGREKLEGTYAARVVHVILDEDDDGYIEFGKNDSIGMVFFLPIGEELKESAKKEPTNLPFAKPLDGSTRTYPLLNEIVLVTQAPSSILSDRDKANYYTRVISIWNNPNHNAYPTGDTVDLGFDIEEQRISPLQPFYGDTILEGRLGQTIRFSGEKHPDNIYTDDSNKNKPFIIISNGQVLEKDGNNFTVENINKDDSSIFLTSDHLVPLEQSRTKYKAADIEPIDAGKYKGKQIILNSGRLYFNSKEEDILFSAKESFGVTAKDINLDGEDYISLDAKKIHLGEKARLYETQPVILGDSLEYLLDDLLNSLTSLSKAMAKAQAGGKPVTSLMKEAPKLRGIVRQLKRRINPSGKSEIKSEKTFTE